MRPADAHLNPQEFELLLFGVADSSNSNAVNSQALEAQQHLDTCALCRATAERYRNAEEMLKGLETGNKASFQLDKAPTRGTECPDEQIWLSVAAGLTKGDEAKPYIAHAATCDWCGPLLKEGMEDLAQDLTPEEEEVLASLPSASPAWQHEMGKKLAAANQPPDASGSVIQTYTSAEEAAGSEKEIAVFRSKKKLSIFRSARFVWANVGVALLAAVFWVTWLMIRQPDINQLLAQAYRDQRTIQLRMSGAKHSRLQTERGPAGVHMGPPASLLNAKSIINQGLRKSPESRALFEQKGRAELLEGDYRSAIVTLQHAKDLPNASPTVLTDLATAYFQRAETEDHPTDYGTAAELLSAVLQRNPDDEIALFNRAIVYERLMLYEKAINDWGRYLQVSRDEGWDGEAQEYLARLKQRLR